MLSPIDPNRLDAIARARHELGLLHFQSERFQALLARTLAALSLALGYSRRPYVAFSGGVDSTAALAIAAAIRDDLTVAWTDDELEYPETVELMSGLQQALGAQMVVTLGRSQHAGWFTPWTDRPFWREPLPGSHRKTMPQDAWMAARGHDLTILGTRADESRKRRDWLLSHAARTGGLYTVRSGTGLRCCPLWDWTADDVWALIAGWRLPHNAVYDVLEAIGVPRHRQRVGPLPLTPRAYLADGWPQLLAALEMRYGPRWR